jgi:ribosomal protein S18 acetylase RimI-like enzyme
VTLRPATLDDFDAIAGLFSAGIEIYEELAFEPEQLRLWLTSPRLDLNRDVRLLYEDSALLGYVDVDPIGEDPVRWWCDVRLHPDADFAQIVPELLAWAEERSGPGVMRTWCPSRLEPLRREFERRGLRRIRGSYRMEIELDDLPEPVVPAGIEIRTLEAGQERVAYEVHEETFADSWDHVSEPYEEWRHYLVEAESFDPTLWFLAWDGSEPAAVEICRVRDDVGWIGVLGVRRRWRNRGLGRALLLCAFHEFKRRGLQWAGLGVDAESLTGAHRLYESAGMRVARQLDFFEKPLPG